MPLSLPWMTPDQAMLPMQRWDVASSIILQEVATMQWTGEIRCVSRVMLKWPKTIKKEKNRDKEMG